jgi:hypothetical protein
MELRHTIELIHLSAQHTSREIRRKAITEYLQCHPEINREEAATLVAEDGMF